MQSYHMGEKNSLTSQVTSATGRGVVACSGEYARIDWPCLHTAREGHKGKSAGSISNVCPECRKRTFRHGEASGGRGKNQFQQGLSKISPGQGCEGREAWSVS